MGVLPGWNGQWKQGPFDSVPAGEIADWQLWLWGVLSHFSHVWLFATLWTIARQAPLSMRFSRQEYQNGSLFPSLGDLPNPGIEPASLMSPALSGKVYSTSCDCGVTFIHLPRWWWGFLCAAVAWEHSDDRGQDCVGLSCCPGSMQASLPGLAQ